MGRDNNHKNKKLVFMLRTRLQQINQAISMCSHRIVTSTFIKNTSSLIKNEIFINSTIISNGGI